MSLSVNSSSMGVSPRAWAASRASREGGIRRGGIQGEPSCRASGIQREPSRFHSGVVKSDRSSSSTGSSRLGLLLHSKSRWRRTRAIRVVTKAAALPVPAYTPTQWVAVALGYSCVVGSVFRCLPQIHRILTRKSVEGISFTAILAEFLIYSINLAYNLYYKYPFNTYGDLCISWVVLIFVMVLIQRFKKFDTSKVALVTVLSSIWCYTLFSNSLPAYILSALQAASSVGLALGSRIPQILLNWRQGTTGELSIIMFIANGLGCLIRIFTTIALTGDMLLLSNCVFHFVLNAIIIVQCAETRMKANNATLKGKLSGT